MLKIKGNVVPVGLSLQLVDSRDYISLLQGNSYHFHNHILLIVLLTRAIMAVKVDS